MQRGRAQGTMAHLSRMVRRMEPSGAVAGSVAPRTLPRKSAQDNLSASHSASMYWIFAPSCGAHDASPGHDAQSQQQQQHHQAAARVCNLGQNLPGRVSGSSGSSGKCCQPNRPQRQAARAASREQGAAVPDWLYSVDWNATEGRAKSVLSLQSGPVQEDATSSGNLTSPGGTCQHGPNLHPQAQFQCQSDSTPPSPIAQSSPAHNGPLTCWKGLGRSDGSHTAGGLNKERLAHNSTCTVRKARAKCGR